MILYDTPVCISAWVNRITLKRNFIGILVKAKIDFVLRNTRQFYWISNDIRFIGAHCTIHIHNVINCELITTSIRMAAIKNGLRIGFKYVKLCSIGMSRVQANEFQPDAFCLQILSIQHLISNTNSINELKSFLLQIHIE